MKHDMFEIPTSLERIVRDISRANAKSYLVGGAVIDILQARELKDWDVEVYRLSYQQLEELLSKHGRPNLVGKSFGIIKIKVDGIEYDFSIPRKENKAGVGHKDFQIQLVPEMTPKEAAQRRDLTINSMFFDLQNYQLHDPYNGTADLERGILRHTSEQFSEDPLRVLRIMQLLPRKGKTVAPETLLLCQRMADEYPTIASERVFEEWNKLLLKADKPSIGLHFLVECGWIKWYPELDILRDIPQNPKHHPEGNVWAHSFMVVDNAAALVKNLPDEWQKAFMYGALLHDVGKAKATSDDLTAYGHEELGVPIAADFMERLTQERKLIAKVQNIVKYHMRPGNLIRGNARDSAWRRLHNAVPLNIAGYISQADYSATAGRTQQDIDPASEKATKLYEQFGAEPIRPILHGRDFIALGYEKGHRLGELLRQAYELQIEEGITDRNELIKRVIY